MSTNKANSDNTFMAKVNVRTFIPVGEYPEVEKFNQEFAERYSKINGVHAEVNPSNTIRIVEPGDILEFGDEIVINEKTGEVLIYPKEIFKELSKKTVEIATPIVGALEEAFNKAMAHMSEEDRAEFYAKKKTNTSRFQYVKVLEKI